MSKTSSKGTEVTAGAVAYSIAHPTTLLYADDHQTWISSEADANNAQTLWYTGTSHGNKTNYDPCPPGYQVPVQNAYAWYTYFISTYVSIESGYAKYSYNGMTTYYPAGGYLNGSFDPTDKGERVRCWAANLNSYAGYGKNMQARALQVTISTSSINNGDSARAAFGLNVRCMKI